MSNSNEDKSINTEEYNKRLMNNVVRLPMVIGPAQGSSMLDVESGQELVDYWGDEGVCSLGYNTPEVVQAVLKFFGSGHPHQLPDIYPNQRRWDAAELICDRTGMDRIFFANSGAEANEGAIKMARKYWWDQEGQPMVNEVKADVAKRHVILTIEGNFHGRTALAMAAGDFRVSPYHRWGFGEMPKGFGVLAPSEGWKQVVTDGVIHSAQEPDWDTIAAINLAPVLGNNCVKTYPREFWEKLAQIREEHGLLLIYDDVQAGSGRAGYFATWQHPDIQVKPDIMMLAKGIAMGFPMSCILARDDVAATFTPGVHFNTFGGSPFVCHMAVEMYRWLDEHIEEVREKGELIRKGFAQMEWIKEHDGSGLLNAFLPDFEAHGYDGFKFIHEARTLGLSLATHRQFGPIRFTPRLNVPVEEVREALAAINAVHMRLAK